MTRMNMLRVSSIFVTQNSTTHVGHINRVFVSPCEICYLSLICFLHYSSFMINLAVFSSICKVLGNNLGLSRRRQRVRNNILSLCRRPKKKNIHYHKSFHIYTD